VQGQIAPPAWANLLLLGAAQAIEPRLQAMVGSITVRARSGRLLRAPVFGQRTHHLVLSCDHLHAEPALDSVLVSLREAMLPGAALVMTAPFNAHAADTVAADRHQAGVLGWDILARLSRAGFATPAAHLYWSQEFGYLGPFNFIFSAMAA
jgi:hypothetical protein